MALNIWTQPSGYNLGTFAEKQAIDIVLPLAQGPAFNGVPPPSYDGTGHHPTAPLRNAAGTAFTRLPINSYADGIHAMRSDLPNARTVSNIVVKDPINHGNQADPNGYSGFMYAFGQFLTHDLEFARPGTGNIDVIVPAGDTELTPGSHIPVTRNAVAPNTGTDTQHPALPMNDVTGWIDCGVVYGVAYPPGVPQGPTPFQNPVNLREGGSIATTGKLLTSSNGQYGPIVNGSFLFGDPRGTENPDLTSVQTLFIREHNWHVDRLKALHPTWTGEQLYQRARSIVIAEFQNITYKEWLPKVIGNDHIPAYTGFNPAVDSTIKIEFAAAAMRFGHSIVSDAQDRVDEQGNVTESLTLAQAFFLTPAQFERNGGANGFLRKLASDVSNKLDVHIIDDLRNLLNDPPAAEDLAATNIQRGRDLGLPSLNQMRIVLGFPVYTSFSQITSDSTVATALQTAYTDINKVDLWVGGLAEDPATAAMVGPTFQSIIIDQFTRLRDGDNQWYENIPWPPEELAWIKETTLSDIILRNTDTVRMQSDSFVAVERADLYNGTVNTVTARSFPTSITLPPAVVLTFKIISGKLPPGLSIIGPNITGRPYEVARDTTFTFCIRASQNGQFSDRTFTMTVTNGNGPVFITPAGELDMGPEAQYFLMDKTYVDFQLQVFDANVAAGAKLKYFIASGAGSLPPGLTLTPDGKITGFVLPLLYVTPQSGDGSYDNSYFDAIAYDFSIISTNGFDSYNFDDVFYDFNLPNNLPRQLNRNYQFVVSVTDGTLAIQRTFKIFVVGDDFFKADNTVLTDSTQYFTADVTYLRPPVWSTDGNLGLHRANNYITIPLETYDREYVLYTLEVVNARNTAITSTYVPSDNQATNTNLVIKKSNTIPLVNQYLTFDLRVNGATSKLYKITGVSAIGNGFYRLGLDSPLEVNIPDNVSFLIGDLPTIPPGMTFDGNASILAGQVPYQPAVTKYYNFTITATRISSSTERARSSRLFTVGIIGEIDSTITWNTPSNLGTLIANLTSNLSLSATTSVPDAELIYTITAGKLPFGLTLTADGELVGRANQYTDPTKGTLGLTSFKGTSFDQNGTTFDRIYTFTVQAQDQFGYSATTRTFRLSIISPDTLSYSNIKTKPYLNIPQRTTFRSFINNSSVFTPSSIYRPNDPNFGIQAELKMIIYAGIETKAAAAYVGAMGLNHKRKQFYFGDLKSAVAIVPGTHTEVYEVVYMEMIDPLEPNGKRLANSLSLTPSEDYITTDSSQSFYSREGGAAGSNQPYLSIDSTAYQVSDPHPQKYFPNSISNWQDRLKVVGSTERNYLPLWMRSVQPGTYKELGFVLAVPICYCKVGTSATILANIKNIAPFDFKQLNYTVDRYIIDAVVGQTNDKYLVFRNDRITI